MMHGQKNIKWRRSNFKRYIPGNGLQEVVATYFFGAVVNWSFRWLLIAHTQQSNWQLQ